MAEAIDIRELNERIEKQSAFVTNGAEAFGRITVNRIVE